MDREMELQYEKMGISPAVFAYGEAVLDRLTAMRKEISADLDSERERADRITLDTPI